MIGDNRFVPFAPCVCGDFYKNHTETSACREFTLANQPQVLDVKVDNWTIKRSGTASRNFGPGVALFDVHPEKTVEEVVTMLGGRLLPDDANDPDLCLRLGGFIRGVRLCLSEEPAAIDYLSDSVRMGMAEDLSARGED